MTSAYLLNYAPDEAALHLMCHKIADSLAEGGEFVYLTAAAYERALRAAGLPVFTWNPTEVSPEESRRSAQISGRTSLPTHISSRSGHGARTLRAIPLTLDHTKREWNIALNSKTGTVLRIIVRYRLRVSGVCSAQ